MSLEEEEEEGTSTDDVPSAAVAAVVVLVVLFDVVDVVEEVVRGTLAVVLPAILRAAAPVLNFDLKKSSAGTLEVVTLMCAGQANDFFKGLWSSH